jgi:putative transposase
MMMSCPSPSVVATRNRHQEFLAFLNHLDRSVPAGLDIHLVADDYGTHKHPKVKA